MSTFASAGDRLLATFFEEEIGAFGSGELDVDLVVAPAFELVDTIGVDGLDDDEDATLLLLLL